MQPTETRPARIRLEREQAMTLFRLYKEERHRLVILRAIDRSKGLDIEPFKTRIEMITKMQEELERTMAERGWLP